MKTTRTSLGALSLAASTACSGVMGPDDNTESHWLVGTVQVHPTPSGMTSSDVVPLDEPDDVDIETGANNVAPDSPDFEVDGLETNWTRQWGGPHHDKVDEIGADAQGNLIVIGHVEVGSDDEGAEDRSQYIVKLSGDGEELWRKETPDRREFDLIANLAVNAAGDFVVASSVTGEGYADASVAHYDAGGNILWTTTWGDARRENVYGVALDASGNVLVVGAIDETNGPGDDQDAWLTKLDAEGNILWTRQFEASGDGAALQVASDALGNIVVGFSGGYESGLSKCDIMKFDPDGEALWTRCEATPGVGDIYSLRTDADGNVFVGGAGTGASDDGYVAKLDPEGAVAWHRGWPDLGLKEVTSIAIAGDGSVIVGSGYPSREITLTRFTADGDPTWWGSLDTPQTDTVYSVAVVNERIVAAGRTYGAFEGTNAGSADSFVMTLTPLD